MVLLHLSILVSTNLMYWFIYIKFILLLLNCMTINFACFMIMLLVFFMTNIFACFMTVVLVRFMAQTHTRKGKKSFFLSFFFSFFFFLCVWNVHPTQMISSLFSTYLYDFAAFFLKLFLIMNVHGLDCMCHYEE